MTNVLSRHDASVPPVEGALRCPLLPGLVQEAASPSFRIPQQSAVALAPVPYGRAIPPVPYGPAPETPRWRERSCSSPAGRHDTASRLNWESARWAHAHCCPGARYSRGALSSPPPMLRPWCPAGQRRKCRARVCVLVVVTLAVVRGAVVTRQTRCPGRVSAPWVRKIRTGASETWSPSGADRADRPATAPVPRLDLVDHPLDQLDGAATRGRPPPPPRAA